MDLRAEIEERFRPAFDALLPGADPVVRPSDRADFQVNGAIGLARRLGATRSSWHATCSPASSSPTCASRRR